MVKLTLYEGYMGKIHDFFKRIKNFFADQPLKTYVTILLEGMGLIANTIAIITFIGARNTPKESPNFYINNQEYFVWTLIAVVYTLGLISARFKRRWRKKVQERSGDAIFDERFGIFKEMFFGNALNYQMFVRNFSFTLVTAFPLTFVYIRAMQAVQSGGTSSPWNALGTSVLVWVPVTLLIMLSSSIFDKALSLYAGD